MKFMHKFLNKVTRPLERKIPYKIKIKDDKYRLYLEYDLNKSILLKALKKFNKKTKQSIELSEGEVMVKPQLYKYLKHQLTKTLKKIEKLEQKKIQEKHGRNFLIISSEIGFMSFVYSSSSNFVKIKIMVYGVCHARR